MLVLAHRGVHQCHPENSLGSFQAAVDAGADGIELDLRLSGDGVPVVYHDRFLPDDSAVVSRPLKEIRETVGYEVPSLDQVVGTWPGLYWNLELKSSDVAAECLRSIRSFRSTAFLISSFDHHLVMRLREEWKGMEFGFLIAHKPLTLSGLMGTPGTYLIWDYETVSRRLVELAMDNGCRSLVYGPHSLRDHEYCAGMDLHGVITDHVSIAMDIRGG